MKRLFSFLIVVMMFLSLFAFVSQSVAGDVPWPTTAWQSSTPEEQGVDSQALLNLMQSTSDVHTVLAIRHGKVILDASRYPFSSSQPHALFSATTSFVSTLVGIAIDKGYIKDIKQSIWDFFPKDKTANMDARKEAITIEDLLTQRTGLLIDDDLNIYKLTAKDDAWVQHILDKPMQNQPGTVHQYWEAHGHLVSALVQIATKMSAADFAAKYLFAPLGITDATWVADPQGVSTGGNQLFMSPLSMAKLGYLYLHGGQWDGQQIVSEEWTKTAVITRIKAAEVSGVLNYGYLWWTSTVSGHEAYVALGALGQAIWVVPDLDLVVVTTNDIGFISRAVVMTIINASTSDKPLPANEATNKALQTRIDELMHPTAATPKSVPDAIKIVSGKVFQLQPNDFGWTSFSIDFAKPEEALITIGVADKTISLPVGLDNVPRLSTDGLPAEPLWRPLANVPQMLKAGYLGKHLMVYMADSMGMEFWTMNISFSKDGGKMWLTAQSIDESDGGGSTTHDLVSTP